MKKAELSSGFGFHAHPMEDIDEFIRQGLERHRELGFASVNLSYQYIDMMGDNMHEHMEKSLQNAEKFGIRYGVAHLPFVSQKVGLPDGDEFNKRMYRCIDAFQLAGVDYAVVHPNSTTLPLSDYDPKAEYDNVMGHLAPFVEYANKVGLSIVIENMRVVHQSYPVHRFGASPDELCKIADELGIGVCWDTGHANIAGLKQSEAITCVGQRLKMLHLNDNFAGDDIHLVPFCGNIDWADTVKGLAAIGYEGYLNFEVAHSRIPASMRKALGQYVSSAGRELQKMLDAARNEE